MWHLVCTCVCVCVRVCASNSINASKLKNAYRNENWVMPRGKGWARLCQRKKVMNFVRIYYKADMGDMLATGYTYNSRSESRQPTAISAEVYFLVYTIEALFCKLFFLSALFSLFDFRYLLYTLSLYRYFFSIFSSSITFISFYPFCVDMTAI